MKKAWIAFAVTLVLILPARIYAMLHYLDAKTGFYSDGGKVIAVISVLLVLGIAATVVFTPGKRFEGVPYRPVRDIPTAAAAALTGIFVLIQSVVGLTSGYGGDDRVLYLIFSVIGLPAGGMILAAAYEFATGEAFLRKHPLLALIPTLWGCVLLIFLFVTYAATVNVVENVYTTFTVVFLLLFLFTQAKLLTGVESEKSARQIYPVAFSAALLSLVTSIPGCVLVFSGRATAESFPAGLLMANIVMAVYALVFLTAQWKSAQAVPEQPEAELPKEESVPVPANVKQAEPILIRKNDREEAPSDGLTEENLLECAEFLNSVYGGAEEFSQAGKSPFQLASNVENAD